MKTVFAALIALAAAAPALAAPDAPTFRDLEFHHEGQARLAAADAHFNARIPAGTTVADAHAVLRAAGAMCEAGVSLTCTYSGTEAVENALRSVHWTVDVGHADGAVTGLTIDRQSIGA